MIFRLFSLCILLCCNLEPHGAAFGRPPGFCPSAGGSRCPGWAQEVRRRWGNQPPGAAHNWPSPMASALRAPGRFSPADRVELCLSPKQPFSTRLLGWGVVVFNDFWAILHISWSSPILKYTSQSFLIYSQSCTTVTSITCRTFYHPQKKPSALWLHP